MQRIKVTLGCSGELKADREHLEQFVHRKNKQWTKHNIFLELVMWEDFDNQMVPTGLQNEYNKAVQEGDIFLMLYHTKVGKFTLQEFETAVACNHAHGRPIIYVFVKKTEPPRFPETDRDAESLIAFRGRLDALGHFPTVYRNSEDLLLQFSGQLERLLEVGKLPPKDLGGHPSPLRNNAPTTVAPYRIDAIFQLLQHALSSEELETFSMIHFPEVQREYTPGMQQITRIKILITHAQSRGILSELLQAIQSQNPTQYAHYAPYQKP